MGEQPRPAPAIGLAELIVAVRDELEKADAARLDRADDATLELREVELELQFEVRRARSGRGGLDFQVVSADESDDAEASRATPPARQTQKLRVLYGPAFKLVEIEEGVGATVPDWLHASSQGAAAVVRSEAPARLALDELDELAELEDLGDLGEPPEPEVDTSEV
jgi:hypothetical protein